MICSQYTVYIHIICIPTYIHIDTYVYAYKHADTGTYIHSNMQTQVPSYIHTYIPPNMQTQVPSYIHTYIHMQDPK